MPPMAMEVMREMAAGEATYTQHYYVPRNHYEDNYHACWPLFRPNNPYIPKSTNPLGWCSPPRILPSPLLPPLCSQTISWYRLFQPGTACYSQKIFIWGNTLIPRLHQRFENHNG